MAKSLVVSIIMIGLLPQFARCENTKLTPEKAELMGRVEDVFLHNFRDITWRKSIEWGDVKQSDDGQRTIRYTFEALIWDKDHLLLCQDFTFTPEGECARVEKVKGFPRPVPPRQVDVSTQEGLIELVEEFFGKNYRDVSVRKSIEWGKPGKDDQGNTNIRYKYEATIGGQDKKIAEQVFTFDPQGKFVSVKDVSK